MEAAEALKLAILGVDLEGFCWKKAMMNSGRRMRRRRCEIS